MIIKTLSYCTVCMNRAEHLKQTLPVNIRENHIQGKTEFIVLDYNSSDDLAEWVEQNMQEYILSGALKFYKTFIPQSFHRSHSRNQCLRLGTGDLLCNVDADNFLGKNFSQYLFDEFKANPDIIVRGSGIPNLDTLGRICMRRNDFYAIGGYDEYMDGYGAEDDDLVFRTNIFGREIKYFNDKIFSITLKHTDIERISNEKNITNIKNIYISFVNFRSSEFLILFNDASYHLFTYTDLSLVKCQNITNGFVTKLITEINSNRLSLIDDDNYPFPTNEDYWVSGTWNRQNDIINLIDNESKVKELKENKDTLQDGNILFYPIIKERDFHEVLFYYTQIKNRHKLKKNFDTKTWRVNDGVIGYGTVFKNFDYNNPLELNDNFQILQKYE